MSLELFPDFACQRVFLGWDAPLLPAAVKHLASQAGEGHRWRLSDWVCVLPSAQSRLRFRQLLQAAVPESDRGNLPTIITAGELPERLYEPSRTPAIEFEQTLAWTRVLRRRDPIELRPLLPVLPEGESLEAWIELGSTLRRLSEDLASNGVSFAEVVDAADSDADRNRWELLQGLFDAYLRELRSASLSDPLVERRQAISAGRVRSDRPIALVGTSDLNESIVQLLNQLDGEVIACIAAPPEQSDRFDWVGRFKTSSFLDWELPIEDDQLIPATDISDTASVVSGRVRQCLVDRTPDQVSIGVTDPSHVLPIELQLLDHGVGTYRHIGWHVSMTSVGRLIECIRRLVIGRSWDALAALVRHADVHRIASEQLQLQSVESDFLIDLDRLRSEHLPVSLDHPLPRGIADAYPAAVRVRDWVDQWLAEFLSVDQTDRAARPIADWCESLLHCLDRLYDGMVTSKPRDNEPGDNGDKALTAVALENVRELLGRFSRLSSRLDVAVSASSAMGMLIGRLAEARVGRDKSAEDVQIRGWLDLPLDDSPAMVVCGLNHPFVPSAVTSDPFLPGSLRAKLRLSDNDRRYARDVFAMQVMLSSRKEICFVVGKTAADGSPTPPSRLVAAARPETVARRIRLLSHRSAHDRGPDEDSRWDAAPKRTELPLPTVTLDTCPVRGMSVTAFKMYLECPFRFYLRHVLKLKPVDDSARELAANQFGDLVHAALENFGVSDQKDEADEQKIFEALRHHLNEHAAKRYGRHTESAVRLQIRQAELRLRHVAAAQAVRIAEGWRIYDTEAIVDGDKGAAITVDGQRMPLHGRLDRIDYHAATGRWAILDYKTHGHKPEKKHLRTDPASGQIRWIDLQLPLYRQMIPALGIDTDPREVQLGYFNVSDKAEQTRVNVADFGESLMDEAKQLIEDCVRRIFACDFAPTTGRVLYDDYAMILQTGVASRLLQEAMVSGEGEDE
ncbi:PD-(D/E)XK nuclease family protein [Roseiconus nitratireducens]|uniref:PD-(D/E)XK nuclease family protein n=1 Tax=Roseiconus nitratireducens TaxID=2605748 RepID=A0A5M6DAD0_9BACT|nr:PD-(D/E)XK nuclease family protein [Roseiconus nitratireducens]KAA5543232.1 PD-(D/E)XK nuclease family protein [Roseiconus nitratireducens]